MRKDHNGRYVKVRMLKSRDIERLHVHGGATQACGGSSDYCYQVIIKKETNRKAEKETLEY